MNQTASADAKVARSRGGDKQKSEIRDQKTGIRNFVPFLIADTEQELVCTCMTTQQKITAIQAIVTNHQDNVAAMQAANVGQGLGALVIEAMNTALKNDLAVIFAANSSRPTGKRTMRAVAQNVRRKRRT